jgi:arylsulfatase A-like enzyme
VGASRALEGRVVPHVRTGVVACLLLAALSCAAGCGEGPQTAEQAQKPAASAPPRGERHSAPNLILITLDTVRADALGTYGQTLEASPNLDRLATEGVLFERATTSNPETLPAHATLFTGRWPFMHGVRSNAGYVLADRNVTLAEHLSSRGYATGAEVAALVLGPSTRVTQGFAHYRGADSANVKLKRIARPDDPSQSFVKQVRVGADISARGIEFIRKHRTRKFFLWLHYFDAHKPWAPPAALARKLAESPYHAELASADQAIARVIAELRRLRLAKRTLVIVTADHGEGLGEHGEDTHAFFVYDTTMRVPLILWGLERLPAGRRITAGVRTVDVAPTALALMGLPPLPGADGVSLVPLIQARVSDLSLTAYGEATALSEVFGTPPLRFVDDGRWKYIHKVSPELYDVRQDPGEARNLAGEEPDVVARMSARLAGLLAEAPTPTGDARVAVDPDTAAQLQALGYLAQGGDRSIVDDAASLELRGDDPNARAADMRALSNAGAQIESGRFQQAIPALRALRERNPDSVIILGRLSEALLALGRNAEALEVMERIHSLDASQPVYLNNHAWALATVPEPELRDGERAVLIASALIDETQTPDPHYLDTLAAALAEAGRFEEAVQASERAVLLWEQRGGDRVTLDTLRKHLARLKSGEPIRSDTS